MIQARPTRHEAERFTSEASGRRPERNIRDFNHATPRSRHPANVTGLLRDHFPLT